jgi:hypothetical protein
MAIAYNPQIVTSGLVLYLDAGNVKSYSGSGTIWNNLVGPETFAINASAYNNTGPRYMDFNGAYGCAKKVDSDFIVSGNVTCVCWTRIKNSLADWRTLLRGRTSGNDHQVIVQSGTWNIGMYDNVNGTGFNNSGFSQQDLPGYASNQWNMLAWRWNNSSSPYYSFSYNDTPTIIRGSNNSINARFKHGFCSIGAYNNEDQSNVNNASQYWGDISSIFIYNRVLTSTEITQNFNALRGRFGI